MAEQFCGREETHGPHGECNGGMFSSEPNPAFEVWVTKWFADHLTSDTFKHLGDDEFAALLAADMKAANWSVFKTTKVPFTGFFRVGTSD